MSLVVPRKAFQILSWRVNPYTHLSILISFNLIQFTCFFIVANVSAPYHCWSNQFRRHHSAHNTPLHFFQFIQPGPIDLLFCLRFHTTFLFCTRPGAFEMSKSIQFLSNYLHWLSVSLYILSESKIHKLSFHPANPHPLPLLLFFSSYPDTQ